MPQGSASGVATINDHLHKEGTMRALDIADCINVTCPWSGKPVQADSLTEYGGHVVGFCNPGCRDRFASAVRHFEEAKTLQAGR